MMLGRGGVTQVMLNLVIIRYCGWWSWHMKPKIILTLIIILCFRVGLAGCASLLQSLRGPTEPFLCQGSIWLDDHDRNPKNKTDHQCMPRTPFTTQWADPSLLGTSSSRLLFLMLFSMQVGIVIPVLLVFHASLCFIMLTMLTMLIMLIMFNVQGGGRVSPWGTSTQAMPLGSHSCRWWEDDHDKTNIDDDDNCRRTSRGGKGRAQQRHFYDLHCAKKNRSLCWLKQRLIGYPHHQHRHHSRHRHW